MGGGIRPHLIGTVGVNIQCKTGRSVTQEALHGLYICPCGNGHGGGCVSQIVGPCVRASDGGGSFFEVCMEYLENEVPPAFCGKNTIVWVIPYRTGGNPVFPLPFSLSPEIFKSQWRRLNYPWLSAFRGRKDVILSATLFFFLELLVDRDLFLFKVDLLP